MKLQVAREWSYKGEDQLIEVEIDGSAFTNTVAIRARTKAFGPNSRAVVCCGNECYLSTPKDSRRVWPPKETT